MIIAAYTGAGKTYFCKHVEGAKDFVSMPYKYYMPKMDNDTMEEEKIKADISREINPEYPNNYINAIVENKDKYKYLFIPPGSQILAGLEDRNIPYILCFPIRSAKEKYLNRLQLRGYTEEFIDIFIGGWDKFMNSFRDDEYGAKIILNEDQYLLDVKVEIDNIILSGEIPIQDYLITGRINSYLIGSKIIDMFVVSKDSIGYTEGGLTVIFEKGKERGILIYGYNEVGEWISFLQVGNKVIRKHYFDLPYRIDQLIKEYHIGDIAVIDK